MGYNYTVIKSIKTKKVSLNNRVAVKSRSNPGTAEGRRLGGLRSLATHRLMNTGFKVLRDIRKPKYSARLAELMGILAGDGHVGEYQVSIVTNASTDYEHALHAQRLLNEAFDLPVSLLSIKESNAVTVLLSSKAACVYLRKIGISTSHKTRDQLQPPEWVRKRLIFRKAYLRGLVDTDGCVYLDRHKIRGKDYASICIAFTNASVPLLDFVENTFRELDYSPTRYGRHVRLRRKSEVLRYANEIGFSNPKHSQKIAV